MGSIMQHPQLTHSPRRGNTMVLVVGILALLVIVATGYVTRTHSGRLTAASQRQAVLREDSAQVIGGTIATEIAEALFVHPVDPIAFPPGTTPPSANTPRIALQPLDLTGDGVADYVPVRYGADPFDVIDNATGAPAPDGIPDRPYNFAPYAVYPWTNWPDEPFGVLPVGVWPRGPGAPSGLEQIVTSMGNVAIGAGNPPGYPGYGDIRWLACLEPVRHLVGGAFSNYQAFSHWTHMSYLPASHNGWRLVTDISDVFGHDANPGGGLLMDLDVPVEQWLPFRPLNVNPVSGVSHYPAYFMEQWLNWFDFTQYGDMYANFEPAMPALTPPANFYDLSDFDSGVDQDGDGSPIDVGERVQDEFIPGTNRWNVSRVLADADGDGFTDSFWFLAPVVIEGGIRQVVAVRIIDNSSMLNANAATRFVRADRVTARAATSGATPSDLALAGDITDPLYPSSSDLHTGFFDDPQHHEIVGDPFDEFGDTTLGWNVDMWPDLSSSEEITFLGELGLILPDGSTHPDFPEYLHSVDERLRYWQFVARDPESASGGLTPFTLADELELRMFLGQNVPWTASRFERAVQANVRSEFINFPGDSLQLLHGNLRRVETSEYIAQLTNRELVQDSRHRLTLFSGARNDIMPPWLWSEPFALDYDLDGFVDLDDLREFQLRTRKYDLRYPWTFTGGVLNGDVDRDGLANELIPGVSPLDDDINDDTLIDGRDHRALLAQRLAAALGVNDIPQGSYFDDPAMTPDEEVELTERLAASYAANVAAWTDSDNIPLALQDEGVHRPRPRGVRAGRPRVLQPAGRDLLLQGSARPHDRRGPARQPLRSSGEPYQLQGPRLRQDRRSLDGRASDAPRSRRGHDALFHSQRPRGRAVQGAVDGRASALRRAEPA
jgi:hypothetical protein